MRNEYAGLMLFNIYQEEIDQILQYIYTHTRARARAHVYIQGVSF